MAPSLFRPVLPALLLLAAAHLAGVDFTDGTGRTVAVAGPPRAVVSLSLMTDDFAAALLPAGRIRAFSRSADDPVLSTVTEAARRVPGRAWTDLEVLVKLAPDLVLAADWTDPEPLAFLRARGVNIYVVKTPRSWAEVKARLSDLGGVLGVPGAAEAERNRLEAREAGLARVRSLVVRPATVLEYNAFGTSMGAGTLWNEMTALAGLRNLAADLPADGYGYAALSREWLLKLDPDWLVVPSEEALAAYGQPDFLRQLRGDPLYRRLRAVQTGQVLFLPESLKTSTSQAALGAAAALQHAAYPNLR